MNTAKNILKKRFYDLEDPSGFTGLSSLLKETKLKKSEITKWLQDQDTYTLHKQARKRFKRRRIVVGGINHLFQADLIDASKIKDENDEYRYILTCIDVFSKRAWAVPIKTKKSPSIIPALSKIFSVLGFPKRLNTDKGKHLRKKIYQINVNCIHIIVILFSVLRWRILIKDIAKILRKKQRSLLYNTERDKSKCL